MYLEEGQKYPLFSPAAFSARGECPLTGTHPGRRAMHSLGVKKEVECELRQEAR
jgi:hypothetical protein